MARPPEYTTEIGEAICLRIAEGESLRSICRDEAMPARSTVLLWAVSADEHLKEFSDQYAKACRARAEGWAEECVDIADGKRLEDEGDGAPSDAARDRLRVDTRKWIASKMLPKFADRLDINAKVAVSGIDDLLAATDEEGARG